VYLLDLGKIDPFRRQQDMPDAVAVGPDDFEAVAVHKVVYGRHRTYRRILDRQDSVIAHSLLDGVEDIFETFEVEDGREFHNRARSLLRI
jgi:hypothetical protein